jgi:CRP/FNR family cyclic AMP-dependent transcriptional regulator
VLPALANVLLFALCISYRLDFPRTVTNVTFLAFLGLILMITKTALQDAAAWFHVLDSVQQERVTRDVSLTQYAPGALIERRGEPAQAWLGVVSGLIKVSVGNSDGKVATLMGVPAGGWLGEGSLLKDETRKYDLVALRNTTIARLPDQTFHWLLDHSIPFNRYLLHQLNERVGQFVGKAESDRLLPPDARVARCLTELFNPLLYPSRNMRLDITQEEVGYLARISRQRANQALGKLEFAGLLKVEYGALQVLDLEGLMQYGQ